MARNEVTHYITSDEHIACGSVYLHDEWSPDKNQVTCPRCIASPRFQENS